MTLETLLQNAQPFINNLRELKATHVPEGFTWYGYDILANLAFLDALLVDHQDLLEQVRHRPIADIGGADGDLAFVLEHGGFDVEMIDNPPTNWNHLRGAYHLKQLLNSSVVIREIDLDTYFQLPRHDYGLVLFLGILYHLKNPFYVLEHLARASEYCILSTKVARYTADRAVHLGGASVAYLVDADECNNDPTNFWIFSMPGLEKILRRTGWEILSSLTVGDTVDSDPSNSNHDERAFLLLRSIRSR